LFVSGFDNRPAPKPTQSTIVSVRLIIVFSYLTPYPNLHIIPQTKNPAAAGLDGQFL